MPRRGGTGRSLRTRHYSRSNTAGVGDPPLRRLYSPAVMQTRWPARVVFVLVIAYLLIAIPMGLRNTFLRLRVSAKTAGAPLAEVRAHAFGRRYVAAIHEIRRAIPANEP